MRDGLILWCYTCERPSPLFGAHGEIAYICEFSLHFSCKQLSLNCIYVTFIHIDFQLDIHTNVLMYPISVSYS